MHHSSPARFMGKAIPAAAFCILSALTTKAQLVPASNPDVVLSTTANPSAPAVSCDMLETAWGRISTIAWDDNAGALIEVIDASAGSITIPLPAGAANPDVVLADDMSNPGSNYIVAAVYINGSGGVVFETFTITGAGMPPGSLSYFSNGSSTLSSSSTSFPHIDMFADINNPINGLPSMHEFVLTWGQGFGGSSVIAQYGDISMPFSPYNTTVVFSVSSGSLRPDVAASFDISTGKQYAYFAIENNSTSPGLTFADWDVATSSVGSAMLFPVAPYLPHIEAMGVFDPGTSPTPWTIAAPIPLGSNVPLFMFDKVNPSGVNCSTTPGFLDNGPMASAVAAGAGITPPGAYYCNDNYTIGWHSQVADYVTQAVDYYTGNISTTYPFYYQVSPNPAPGFQKESMAISSTSNLGKGMLTAWYNGLGRLLYKYTPDITAYKPGRTGIDDQNISRNEFSIYPNPAQEKVVVESKGSARITKIELYNILGQMVHAETAGNHDKYTISLNGLAAGSYSLKIYTDKGQAVSKLQIAL